MSIDQCIQDAVRRLACQQFHDGQNNTILNEKECEIYVWPQSWPDASCGDNSGFSAQAITSAPTVVILGPMGDVCVYHGGKFAYKIDQTNESFWACLDDRHMPSKQEHKKECENVGV